MALALTFGQVGEAEAPPASSANPLTPPPDDDIVLSLRTLVTSQAWP